MKKFVVIALVFSSAAAIASQTVDLKSVLTFVAPTVNGVDNINQPDAGLIVYDASDDSIKAKRWGGGWHNLSLTSNALATNTVSTTSTLLISDDMVFADANAGAVTLTLPNASEQAGKMLMIKKIDSTTNAVIVDGSGSETIDSQTNFYLTKQSQNLSLISDGSNWQITGFDPANEILTATSNTKQPDGTPQYHQHGGDNKVTLTPGVWRLTGAGEFTDSGVSPAYSVVIVTWKASDGQNSLTTPASLSTRPNLTTLSAFNTDVYLNLSAANDVMVPAPTLLVKTVANEDVFLDTYSAQGTTINALVSVKITAERVR